jgi:hypothetical protein
MPGIGKRFEKGHKGLKPKGAVSAKTKAWEELGDFICHAGAERYMNALIALEDDKFLEKYAYILEFFKPKLARSELTGKEGKELPTPILTLNAIPKNDSNGENTSPKQEN